MVFCSARNGLAQRFAGWRRRKAMSNAENLQMRFYINGLGTTVGILSAWMLMHIFMRKQTHLVHHINLNDPDKDADHRVSGLFLAAGPSFFTLDVQLLKRRSIKRQLRDNSLIILRVIENDIHFFDFVMVLSLHRQAAHNFQ